MADHKEGSKYVESVMLPRCIEPVKVYNGRKRHLSLPEESCVEKMKNGGGYRDIKKARRVLYEKAFGESQQKSEARRIKKLKGTREIICRRLAKKTRT